MSDAAALRAKANDMEKEEQLRIAMDAAPWPVKMLPTRDDQVQPFVWPYGAQKMIAERKLVREILELGRELPVWGHSLSFHDSFIETDSMRVELLDRLYILFNAHSKKTAADHLFSNSFGRFNERMTAMYRMYESALNAVDDKLLQMQAMYEELKPETRELIKLCTSETQLQRSMFVMRESPTPKKRRLFKTPLVNGNEDDVDSTSPADVKSSTVLFLSPRRDSAMLADRFAVVDAHIAHLECVLDDVGKVLLARRLPSPRASDARLDFIR